MRWKTWTGLKCRGWGGADRRFDRGRRRWRAHRRRRRAIRYDRGRSWSTPIDLLEPSGGRREGERPGRARVGDVPGDERIGRHVAGWHVPRGACPAGVRARPGEGPAPDAGLLLKGETPVIYFYTPRPVRVRVGVDFPQGIWTHWYPQAAAGPPAAGAAGRAAGPPEGRPDLLVRRGDAAVARAGGGSECGREGGRRRASTAGDRAAMRCGTSLATSTRRSSRRRTATRQPARAEYERFLFYRGLGQAHLPLHADAGDGGTLSLESERGWATGCGTSSCSGSRGAEGRTLTAPRSGPASRRPA